MEIKEQDESKREIVKFVMEKLFAPAKKWKFYYSGDDHQGWVDDIRFVKGYHWPSDYPKEKASVTINRVWSIIQKEIPFMTDHKPKIYIEPTEPSDKPAADIITKIIESSWVARDMDRKIPEGTYHAKEVGTGFYHPFWNKKLGNGLGDIDCEVCDPLECFPFAYTDDLSPENCEGFIRARNVSLGWIRKNYPERGGEVKAQVDSSIIDRCKITNGKEGDVRQVSDMGAGSSYTASETHYLPSQGGSSMAGADLSRVTLIICYIKDEAIGDSEEEKDGKKTIKQKELYPNGRVITIAGGIVLEDTAYPFTFFPGYVAQHNYLQPSEFWGESDVKQIKKENQALNKFVSLLLDASRRGIYTVKFIKSTSGIDASDFYVSGDAIYETDIDNPVTELAPQLLPPQLYSIPPMLEQMIEKTAGMQEFNASQTGDLPSGRSLAEYSEMQQTRLRQKLRNLETSIRKIGQGWLEMIIKNYTDQRIMRLNNPNNPQGDYVFIFREEDEQKAAIIRQQAESEELPGTQQMDPQTGQPIPGSGQKKFKHVLNMAEIKGGLDLNVSTGSTVSISKYATFDQAFALYRANAIDRPALLDAADYPDRDEINKRMDQMAQQAQQGAMQAAQMQAQQEQMKLQTELQKTSMNNETSKQVTMMKEVGNQDGRLEKIKEAIGNGGREKKRQEKG